MNFSRRPAWQYRRWCKQTSKGSQQKVESIDERSARICINSVSIKETASLLSISDWIESFKRKIYFSVTFVIKQCKRFFEICIVECINNMKTKIFACDRTVLKHVINIMNGLLKCILQAQMFWKFLAYKTLKDYRYITGYWTLYRLIEFILFMFWMNFTYSLEPHRMGANYMHNKTGYININAFTYCSLRKTIYLLHAFLVMT